MVSARKGQRRWCSLRHQLLTNKACDSDPLPTWLLKKCATTLRPYITTMLNASLAFGRFSGFRRHGNMQSWHHCQQAGMDETSPTNYRPVASLPFISKGLERIVHKQMLGHLVTNNLSPEFQLAYTKVHSTETAVLKVFSDIVDAVEKEQHALL